MQKAKLFKEIDVKTSFDCLVMIQEEVATFSNLESLLHTMTYWYSTAIMAHERMTSSNAPCPIAASEVHAYGWDISAHRHALPTSMVLNIYNTYSNSPTVLLRIWQAIDREYSRPCK